jgi:hypothetical protein
MSQADSLLSLLAEAGFTPERCGKQRLQGLTQEERQFYRQILRAFTKGGSPSSTAVQQMAAEVGVQVEEALSRLVQKDLIQLDLQSQAIHVAYPFAGYVTPHQVWLSAEHFVYAMCAVDALGIPFMLGRAATIHSFSPRSQEGVRVVVDPVGQIEWAPAEAVVLIGRHGPSGIAAEMCCPLVHFFPSMSEAEEHLRINTHIQAHILSMPEALRLGQGVFEEVLQP